MNSQLDEEYGAGFEGTKELLYKYLKDTPGQKIVKYMDKTNTELEESITADTVEKITSAQIEKYIDSQNFKVLDQISKFLTKDEYELWSKNGFEGRTFELMMKQRAKNVKESTELEEDMVDMLIQKFKDSGRVAVRYPRKRLVSVSGRSMPEKDAIETMKRILDKEAEVKEAVEKIACLKCDEVSTAAAWQKNKGFCPVCKTSSQGVAESTELDEEKSLNEEFELLESDEELDEGATELFMTIAKYKLLIDTGIQLAGIALLVASVGLTVAIRLAIIGGQALKDALERAKKNADSAKVAAAKERLMKVQEKLKTEKDPKKQGLIKKAASTMLSKIKNTISSDKKEEIEEGMQELYAVVDENDIVLATASNELAAKRSISSSELPPLSVKDKSKLRIVKTRKQAEVDKPLKEHATPTLEEVRLMKIISLATGSTDSEALYEYALTAPTYTSLVELKENFNRYIQDT